MKVGYLAAILKQYKYQGLSFKANEYDLLTSA